MNSKISDFPSNLKKKNISSQNVLLVMESWGQGGTETYVSGLIKFLLRRKTEVRLVLLNEPGTVKIDGLSPDSITVTGFHGLVGILTNQRPDLLSLHLYTNLLPTAIIGKLFSIPIITTLHMPYSAWGMRHRLYWQMARRISTIVVGVSNKIIDEMKGTNVLKKPIPGGVDALFFRTKKKGPSIGAFNIAAVGRLGKEKDWPTLIKAVKKLSPKNQKKTRVHFYGDGSELNLLKSIARREGIQAEFHGHVDKKDLARALAKSDLSVLPSRFEGMPLSLLECMAAGVPMIISNFLNPKDCFIKHGTNGHIFPKTDASALSKLITWHIERPKRSWKMGRAGRDYVRAHFSEEMVFLHYLDIFRSATQE